MNDKKREPQINLLDDKPIEEDEFGGHQEVAKALDRIITTQKGGISIALTGEFGSGKSSIIKILKKRLKGPSKNTSNAVFIYDTWSHQEDPIRRSFLEELLNFLDREKLIEIDNWSDTINRITKRVIDTTTKSSPVVSLRTFLSALFVLVLIPVGLVILSSVTSGIIEDKISFTHYLTYLSIVLLIGIPLVYLFLYSIYFFWKKNWSREKIKFEPLDPFAYEKHQILNNKTITTPDPTAIEFRDELHSIFDHVLKTKNKNDLILVIDNLDRLTSEKALNIWASLLAFLNPSSFDNKSWAEKIWVIVPINIDALAKVWDRLDTGQKEEMKNLRKGFLEKTFQIKLNVAPPILSDWHEFFKTKLNEAFPNEEDFDEKRKDIFHDIVKLFESREASIHHPTPRRIKVFINNVGALYRQWFDQIPLQDLAFYLLAEEKIKKNIKAFIADEDVKPFEKFHLSSNWKESLIAVHYNVEVKKAPEVLIDNILNEAFSKGDSKDLEDYQDLQGFYTVVENKIKEISKSKNINHIANASIALKGLQESTHMSYLNSWRYLENEINLSALEGELSDNFSIGIITIWERRGTTDKKIVKFLRKFGQSLNKETSIDNWIKHFEKFAKEFEERGDIEKISNIELIIEDDTYLEILSKLEEKGLYKYFPYLVDKKRLGKLVEAYKKLVSGGNLESGYQGIPILLKQSELDINWKDLISIIQNRFDVKFNLKPDEVRELLTNLLILDLKYGVAESKSALKDISKKPHLFHYMHVHWNNDEIASLMVLVAMIYNPSTSIQGNQGQSGNGVNKFNQIKGSPHNQEKVFNSLLEHIYHKKLFNEVISSSEDYNINLLKETIREYLKKYTIEYIDYELLVDDFKAINNTLSPEYFKLFIDKVVETNKDWVKDFLSSVGFDLIYIKVFKILLFKKDLQHKDELLEFLKNNINQIGSETWDKELQKKDSDLLDIVTELNRLGERLELQSEMLTSLLKYSRRVKNSNESNNISEISWEGLFDSLSISQKNEFYDKIASIVEEGGDNLVELIKLNQKVLKKDDFFESKKQQLSRILSSLADTSDLNELKWLGDNTKIFEPFVNSLPGNDRKEVKEELSKIRDEESKNSQFKVLIEEIMSKFNLDDG